MSEHAATIVWRCNGDFRAGAYSRAHDWRFDGGVTVPGSASPAVVPMPHARADAVDPEEAVVAALASCHMLWFLDLARRAGHAVAAYQDAAIGRMGRIARERHFLERITLRPRVAFADAAPDEDAFARLHEEAHARCFIANSLRSEIVIEPEIVRSEILSESA